jgi:3-methylcrotonyl-CoA carboxylase alpha subunit
MPGKIIAIEVQAGDKVKRGQALLVMEAMKMEHTIVAGADGVVENIYFGVGEQVAEGAVLISLEQ